VYWFHPTFWHRAVPCLIYVIALMTSLTYLAMFHCARCERPIIGIWKRHARHKIGCVHCGLPLWAPLNPTRHGDRIRIQTETRLICGDGRGPLSFATFAMPYVILFTLVFLLGLVVSCMIA